MTVPTPVPFSTINPGQVLSSDLVVYLIKVDAASAVNLATGQLNTAIPPTSLYTVFPQAAIVLGQ